MEKPIALHIGKGTGSWSLGELRAFRVPPTCLVTSEKLLGSIRASCPTVCGCTGSTQLSHAYLRQPLHATVASISLSSDGAPALRAMWDSDLYLLTSVRR